MTDAAANAATPDDVMAMAKRAGLDLSPEHMAELVEAYSRIEPMLRTLRRDRGPSIEPACCFDPRRFMPVAVSDPISDHSGA